MNNSLKYFALSMLLATMTGCTEDITQAVGPLPDETSMNNVGSQLYSGKSEFQRIDIFDSKEYDYY